MKFTKSFFNFVVYCDSQIPQATESTYYAEGSDFIISMIGINQKGFNL